ncbi:MAG: YjgP/YjgQ family permease [Planctomycetaceae bacterium]|nr:YjgP/YjgQ family permease [Planctomycetaceae bacterium]
MTLELYLLRRLIGGLVFACGGMALVAVPCVLVHAVHKVAGVGMAAVLGYVPILMLELAPYLLPLGFLLAVVSSYGRLAADNEWTAMLMAGIHPLRLARPALWVALVLSGGLYFLSTNVSPSLNYQKKNYGKNSAMQLLKSLNPGRTELRFGDFYLSALERDPDDRNLFRQVFLHLPPSGEKPAQTIFAQAVQIVVDGSILTVEMAEPRWADERFDTRVGRASAQYDLDEYFSTDAKNRASWRFQTSAVLSERLDHTRGLVARDGEAALAGLSHSDGIIPFKDLRAAAYELHSRSALLLVCPMFLLLGLPTGLVLRRGSQLAALAAAIAYALAYYLISMRMGKVLANSAVVPEWAAAWGATLLGTLIGVFFTWRALRR